VKRTVQGKPTISFVLTVRNASEPAANGRPYLLNCLESLRARVPQAEIVVLDTMSGDFPTEEEVATGAWTRGEPKTHTIAKRFADVFQEWRGPNGTWTREMYAVDDMAAARNKATELASGDWLIWVDHDDVLPDAAEAERILRANGKWRAEPLPMVRDVDQTTPVDLAAYLVEIGKKYPEVEGFWCPYAYEFFDGPYRHGETWHVKTWNQRERIVRNNGHWTWRRPAHEVFVPKEPHYHARLATMAHFLFVHTKKFTDADRVYSLTRHYNVLIRQYEKGEANCQDLLYLENYSMVLCPHRRGEFIRAGYEAANTAIDRARVLIRSGNYSRENGFFFDAFEAYAAAAALAPEYPDSYLRAGELLEKTERFVEAAAWYMRGVNCPPAHPFSDVPPRVQLLDFQLRAALAMMEASRRLTQSGHHEQARQAADDAVRLADGVVSHPAIGPDRAEALRYLHALRNERDALYRVKELHEHWAYLVRNDETQKAMRVLELLPHNMQDHPLVAELEKWNAKMRRHLTDSTAYQSFYEDLEAVGAVPSKEEELTYETCNARTRFFLDYLARWRPAARVCEIGSFDGITLIPLLRSLPDVTAVAVEAQKDAANRLYERAKRFGLLKTADGKDRLTVLHQLDGPGQDEVGAFDAVFFCEVIEHVPDAVEAIRRLLTYLKPDGRLFMSTPWGAFDRGFPADIAKRDPRGHVRAMMPRDVVEAVEAAGGRVLELGGTHGPGNFGDTLHFVVERARSPIESLARPYLAASLPPRPIAFAVASALWDWNATHVERTGIGASEETIVYLARQLGREKRDVEVYTQLPRVGALLEEEVRDGVKYWPREQRRRIKRGATVVVSRAPSWGLTLREATGQPDLDLLLWLQDAFYPDLNPTVAEGYRRIVVLSEWHRMVMHQNHAVPLDRMAVVPNFLLEEHFRVADPPKREPHRFIYASSPDRGLIELLRMWPKIRERWPDATLGIFYGWEGCMRLGSTNPSWNERYRKVRTEYLKLRWQPGIEEYGRVSHARIAQEMMRASVWAYFPVSFYETFCSNAVKARAAGCVPVVTPTGALAETARCELAQFIQPTLDFDRLTELALEAIAEAFEARDMDRRLMADEAIESYRLEAVMPKWRELLE